MSGPQQAQYYSTEFLDCDISLDIVTYLSQVVARSLAASMEEKHQMKQRVKKQTGSSLQTHIITAQVGNISVLEADVLQVGSLKCHYNQPLGYVAYLETGMLEEIAFIIVAHKHSSHCIGCGRV
jgi:hypothetical protein